MPMLRLWLACLLLALSSPVLSQPRHFPYREAGLSESQASAHLLSRFTFGARPGDLKGIQEMGLEAWFARQLKTLPSPELQSHLSRSEKDLRRQKVLRARYETNQVAEVMTDFWFNHFNVATQTGAGPYVLAYERDAIRPHALGSFRELLGATAHHPAMLEYLNNAQSTADPPGASPSPSHLTGGPIQDKPRDPLGYGPMLAGMQPKPLPKTSGINENYARELMELHTLGVDGGYTQKDVQEVARAFTGWTVKPAEMMDKVVVREAEFQFLPQRHDYGPKQILHQTFRPFQGLEEGERILDLLAAHPSTARYLATKLCRRFVCDDPPRALVDRVALRFSASHGDMREVLWTLTSSPEFWEQSAWRAKIKSPFELAVSSVRALGAEVMDPGPLGREVEDMGQPLYGYAAPTGFPDRAQYWINPGLLLHRMNFAARLAAGQVPGVQVQLERLAHPLPKNADEALLVFVRLLLPGVEPKEALKSLGPSARDPEYAQRLAQAASKKGSRPEAPETPAPAVREAAVQAVGVLLGSPEFQRR